MAYIHKKKVLVKIDIEAAELNVVNVPDVASDGSQTCSDGYATELQRNCNGTTLATVIQLQKDRSIGQNRQKITKSLIVITISLYRPTRARSNSIRHASLLTYEQ
jgi:hypothetical protein